MEENEMNFAELLEIFGACAVITATVGVRYAFSSLIFNHGRN